MPIAMLCCKTKEFLFENTVFAVLELAKNAKDSD
jgi:hypothetical protein